MIDVCVINTRPIAGKVLESYRAQAARPVENDVEGLEMLGVKVVGEDLVRAMARRPNDGPNSWIRHDPGALGAVVVDLALQARRVRRKSA
jgi:hypothetical protein